MQQERQRLAAVLDRGLRSARAMRALLDEEHAALLKRDAAAIKALAGRKADHTEQLEQCGKDLAAALKALGIAENGRAVDDWLGRYDAGGRLTTRWNEYRTTLEECAHENSVNGEVVALSRRHSEAALRLLQGQTPDTHLYDPNGQKARSGASPRTLAKA